MGKLVFGGVLTILLACSPARATLLTAEFTADNAFQAYISTSDSTLGTLIGSGTNWEQAQSFSTPLLGVGTFYLHIVAENYALSTSAIAPSDPSGGNPNAILGQFTLTGGDTFGNGSTTLYTSTDSVWRAQSVAVNAAWTAPSGAPSYQYSDGLTNDYNGGPNIWTSVNGGAVANISGSAKWVWAAEPPNNGEAFFSTSIYPQGVGGAPSVPEPSTWAMMVLGFAGLGFTGWRKRSQQELHVATA